MSDRRFTVEQAEALISTLGPILEKLRDAQEILKEEHEHLTEHAPTNGGGPEGVAFLGAINDAGRAVAFLNEAGVVVRDPASGLVDFPSEKDGEQIYLCWLVGEEHVAWWHPTTSGFADRRPL